MPAEPNPGPAGSLVRGPRYCCYGCRLLGESGQKPVPELEAGNRGWFKVAVGAVIAGQAMLLGLAVNLAPPQGVTRWLLHLALMTSSLAVFGILGWPLLRAVTASIRERQITIEQLFLVGIAGAFFASIYSTLTGTGAVYYEVVAVLLTVYTVGKTLGARSRARALAEARKLRQAFDQCQKLGPDGSTVPTRVAEIVIGDKVRVRAGEAIPIDGMVSRGQAFVRETPLTGEPFPIVRRPGDAVFAGSYSEDGELIVEATAPGGERRLDALLTTVERAQELASPLQAQADRLVMWFLPLVIAMAASTFIVWTWRGHWADGLFNALAVLLVACPCAMGLATPIALWNGIAVLAARGLVVSRGEVLDRLASLTHLVFDKTGTLSEESASMIDLATLGGPQERRRLIAVLVAVQAKSLHPVARAFESLRRYATAPSSNASAGVLVKAIKAVPARGIEAWVEGPTGQEHYLHIGQREFMPALAGEEKLLASLHHAALDQLVYVAWEGELRAIAAVRERLRPTIAEAMIGLETLGVTHSVMTGDQPGRAARRGLANVLGGLTPQEKAARVTALRNSGEIVGFVGDGVNDAPAIGKASVGIALGHSAGITAANAGAILYGGDLRTLAWGIALCRRVRASIRSNLVFAAVYNLVGILLAAAGLLHPVVAALLMVVSSFTVSWRALRSTQSADFCCVPGENQTPTRGGGVSCAADKTTASRPGLRFYRSFLIRKLILGGRVPSSTAGETPAATASQARSGARTANRISARLVYAALFVLQAPFLIYLGGLSLAPALCLVTVMLALAIVMARFQPRSVEALHYANMTLAMLGAGIWGMILGWWADAGFSPVALGCVHCTAHQTYTLAGLVNMPWMNLGMLLLGLPPMLSSPRRSDQPYGRLTLGLLSATGMLLGMSYGSFVFVRWLGPHFTNHFLISFAGMIVGMLAGMFFFCELGRAIALWQRARQGKAIAPPK
jgi:Cu+-exporting ATPase